MSTLRPIAVRHPPHPRGHAVRLLALTLIALVSASCASRLPSKSAEFLDETTGMTRASLLKPMAFVETGIYDVLAPDKQPTVLYVGPEEWDRSGDFSYVLWVQVAPGVDGHRIDDIRARGALRLKLDDGTVMLSALDQPVSANSPYPPVAPVGEAAYFSVDAAMLKRMASSHTIILNVRAGDLAMIDFVPRQDTRDALKNFIIDRRIAEE